MTQQAGFVHEHLERDEEAVPASPRSFAFVFAAAFAVAALIPLWRGESIRIWALAVSVALLAVGFLAPSVLAPASRVWQRLGLALHHIISPIVLGLVFYGVLTPFAIVMRLLGKGLTARLHRDPDARTYWIAREGLPPSRMTNQF